MPSHFKRDRFFWVIALQTFVGNLFLGGFGPAQPLLRADQGTSLAIAGLHGTAMGIASILAGLATPYIAHKYGRTNGGWIGMGFFAVGVALFVTFDAVQITLLAAFIAGFGFSNIINSFVTSMNYHFKKDAPHAIGQANGIASFGYVVGTAIVGLIATYSRDQWRLGVAVALPAGLLLFLTSRKVTRTSVVEESTGPQGGRLSRAFWIGWFGFIASISLEFATTFWAAALVQDRTGASPAIATVAIMALGAGMGIGRWYGGRWLHRFTIDRQLFIVLAVELFGFMVLWTSHSMLLSLIALFINGLGISMQFPIQSLRMISMSDNRPDLAIGRTSLAAGIAIAGAPFLLGILGDNIGISRAYLMVPVLVVITALIAKLSPASISHSKLDELEI